MCPFLTYKRIYRTLKSAHEDVKNCLIDVVLIIASLIEGTHLQKNLNSVVYKSWILHMHRVSIVFLSCTCWTYVVINQNEKAYYQGAISHFGGLIHFLTKLQHFPQTTFETADVKLPFSGLLAWYLVVV